MILTLEERQLIMKYSLDEINEKQFHLLFKRKLDNDFMVTAFNKAIHLKDPDTTISMCPF